MSQTKTKIMVSQEVIEQFLLGEDPEKYIVALEYDYRSGKVFKVIQDPIQGKQINQVTFIPFAWVGDLHGKKFYAARVLGLTAYGDTEQKAVDRLKGMFSSYVDVKYDEVLRQRGLSK